MFDNVYKNKIRYKGILIIYLKKRRRKLNIVKYRYLSEFLLFLNRMFLSFFGF